MMSVEIYNKRGRLVVLDVIEQKKEVSVVIVEDYKLTRVGLRSTLNEY